MARKITIFRKLKWAFEWLIYRCYDGVIRLLPMGFVIGTGRLAGSFTWHFLKQRRLTVQRNLKRAYGKDLSPAERNRMGKAIIQQNLGNLMASIKTASLSTEELKEAVELVGVEHYREAKAKGKGVIGVLAHTGNWEVVAQIADLIDPDVPRGAFYRPLANPYIDAVIERRRGRRGARLFAKFGDMKPLMDLLREGGLLGVLCDQRAGAHGHLVPFFNRKTSFTPIAVILARRTGAAMVTMAVQTTGKGRWRVVIGPPLTESPKPNAADVAYRIEQMIRQSPEDYFWLQDRWKAQRTNPLVIKSKGKLLQPAQYEEQEILEREVLLLGDVAPPDGADDVKFHRLTSALPSELEKEIEAIDSEASRGLEFVMGPESLLRSIETTVPCYDQSGKRLSD